MAKDKSGGKYRRSGQYLKGNVDESLSLGTLAASAVVGDQWDEVVNERTRISSILVTWMIDNITSPQGPIVFGVAHSDYSDAEILEVIQNAGSWDSGNKISQEQAKRLVRVIGTLQADGDFAGTTDYRFNEGRPKHTKLNWMLQTGDTLKMWAFNRSAGALATTVPTLRADGHANLWQK